MSIKVGVLMDPISGINIKKDSTFAMLLEAQRRDHQLFYLEQQDLFLADGTAQANLRSLSVKEDPANWYTLGEFETCPLADLDVVLMRKDPPFNTEYIYSTYLLEMAEVKGTLIVNKPSSLRDANEKLFTAHFPQCCSETMVSRNAKNLRSFIEKHNDVILKPLDGMGGSSIFRVKQDDPNISVIIETLTEHGQTQAMAQKFIPEIKAGDKRILMIDGEPVPYSLARIPAEGETRGNLAAGGSGVAQPLSEKDLWIAQQVGPKLREMGLIFVGLDVIGEYLTEINVTSPTCIREIDQAFNLNIAGQLFDAIESKLKG